MPNPVAMGSVCFTIDKPEQGVEMNRGYCLESEDEAMRKFRSFRTRNGQIPENTLCAFCTVSSVCGKAQACA